MQLEDAAFFYTHYVGYSPEDDKIREKTQAMVGHYLDSGLKSLLPDIYEACAKDGVLDTTNIPTHLWSDGNLIDNSRFYMHHELTIQEHAPVYDPETGEMRVFPHYRENKERYTIADALRYARTKLKHDDAVVSDKEDAGAIRHILKRYDGLKKRNIQPIDMLLYLIDFHAKEAIRLIDVMQNEEEVLASVENYKRKLENMCQFKILWRGALDA